MDLVRIVSLVNLVSNLTATFVPVAKTMASDPEGQLKPHLHGRKFLVRLG